MSGNGKSPNLFEGLCVHVGAHRLHSDRQLSTLP